jgi:hypothetical protein
MWRPNFGEVRANFILLVPTLAHIKDSVQVLLERKEKNSSPLQPIVIAIGEEYKYSTQYCVFFNEHCSYFDSILLAVDYCFKLFFVLDLQYNLESYNVWTFIQSMIYMINTGSDIMPPPVRTLCTSVRNCEIGTQ